MVQDLKTSKPAQWYSKLKRMSSYDQIKNQEAQVQSLINFTDSEQAEIIADQFAAISNEYNPLKNEDIPAELQPSSCPKIEPMKVHKIITEMRTNTSTLLGDIPMKIIKEFSVELAFPLADILNRSYQYGEYPKIWKIELVTPVPKVIPTEKPDQLRKIAGLKNFSKISEKILAEYILSRHEN